MRVTLVNPPYTLWEPGREYLARALGHQPPLGLLSIAAYARRHVPGVVFNILDAAALLWSNEETARRVIASQPDVVGITMTTAAARNAQAIAERVKRALPRVTIVVGGPHVSGVGEDCLQQSEAFDLAVVGEGEQTFKELLETLRDGQPLGRTAGLLLRDEKGRVRRTPLRPPIEDLDSLSLPAWDLLPDFPEAYPPNAFFSPSGPAASLVTSRGCPFACTFCDQSTFGHRYRAGSAEYVFQAVKSLQQEYGIRYLVFCDDTFTLDRQRVLEICALMRDAGGGERPLAWSCDANVMTVDRALLSRMRGAGCWSISYGLESGSPAVLESLRKRVDLERAREMALATRGYGIHVKGLFMMGTPEESAETAQETRRFVRSLPLSTMNLSKFTPYPGSELYAQVADGLALDYERLNGMNFVVPSRHLSVPQLEKEYARTIRHFYGRAQAFCVHVPIWLRHWQNVRRLLGIAPRLLCTGLRPDAGFTARAADSRSGDRPCQT